MEINYQNRNIVRIMGILFKVILLVLPLSLYGQGQISRPITQQNSIVYNVSEPDGYINGHGYVDLGLPSGTKWATSNIGATKSEEIGNYYSWGEIKPKEKYHYKESRLSGIEIQDISGNEKYDAASAIWGKNWQIPTEQQMQELIKNCKFKEILYKNVKGILLIGPNHKTLFIPKGGYGSDKIYGIGEGCYLWTGTPNYKWHGPNYPGHPDFHYSTAFKHFGGYDKYIGPFF